jgi:predicted nucleic acid-binding protein
MTAKNILNSDAPFFIDAGILITAFSEKEKKERRIIAARVLDAGISKAHISQESIIDLVNSLLSKNSSDTEAIIEIIEDLQLVFKVITCSKEQILKAIRLTEKPKMNLKDAIIAQAMIDNNIEIIFTENTKNFRKIRRIKAINPFVYLKNKK